MKKLTPAQQKIAKKAKPYDKITSEDFKALRKSNRKNNNGKDVCQILIKEGHAVEYWGGTKKAKVRDDGTWGE